MKAGGTVRCTCDDCLIVFEIFVAPVAEWPEEMEDPSDADVEMGDPLFCPYCGAGDVRVTDRHGNP